MKKSLSSYYPLIVALGLMIMFGLAMLKGTGGQDIPSPLIGKPVPKFNLATIEDYNSVGLSSENFKSDKITLLNFWASWCGPCKIEHPYLVELGANDDINLVAINQKDSPEDARAFLSRFGDPFRKIGVDRNGRVSIDFGVYGIPETFFIDQNGIIRHRHAGVLTAGDFDEIVTKLSSE